MSGGSSRHTQIAASDCYCDVFVSQPHGYTQGLCKPKGGSAAIRQDVRGPSIDLRALIVRAADALHDAADPGGASQMYLAVERELRYLIAALDEEARRVA